MIYFYIHIYIYMYIHIYIYILLCGVQLIGIISSGSRSTSQPRRLEDDIRNRQTQIFYKYWWDTMRCFNFKQMNNKR